MPSSEFSMFPVAAPPRSRGRKGKTETGRRKCFAWVLLVDVGDVGELLATAGDVAIGKQRDRAYEVPVFSRSIGGLGFERKSPFLRGLSLRSAVTTSSGCGAAAELASLSS